MVNKPHLFLSVPDRSYFAIIKKEIHQLAVEAQFTPQKVAEVDIIVAELVSNIIKHGRDGYLLVKPIDGYMEIIAVDEGPGMTDISRMMQDGVSTKNTLGQGLGAIKRLSQVFQVYSAKGWGTIVLSRVFKEDPPAFAKPAKYEMAGLLVPKPGETSCGDCWWAKTSQDRIKVFLGDGLGHGDEAQKAVYEAIGVLQHSVEKSAFDALREVHRGVRKTRGLVGSLAMLNIKEKKWNVCGIGNINTRIITLPDARNYMAYNGILGLNIPTTMKDQETVAERGQILIMCSDGIKTKWDLVKYPNILKYDLSIILAAIFKDNARRTDDMGLVAVKYNQE